jgi:hypothetical protein
MADGAAPLAPEAVTAILRHMNGDHAADCLRIVQGLGARPDASEASMSGVEREVAVFDAVVPDGSIEVRIPWSEPIAERAQVRTEVVRMYEESCAILGVAPPAAGDH